jgi:hypothetical protein
MRFAIFAAAALFALTHTAPLDLETPGDIVYTVCPGWDASIKINSLKLDPNPPSIKKPIFVIANGDLSYALEKGAKMNIKATLGSMVVANQVVDMCDEASKNGLSCPIAKGNQDLKAQVPLPEGIQIPPFVTINIHVEAFNADQSKLFCVDTKMKFVP